MKTLFHNFSLIDTPFQGGIGSHEPVSFCMEQVMAEDIICPQCGNKIGTYDGKETINKRIRCKRCGKTVLFDVSTGDMKIVPRKQRTSLGGKRFGE